MTCRERNCVCERMDISCYRTADGPDEWDVRNRTWEEEKRESAVDLRQRCGHISHCSADFCVISIGNIMIGNFT